MDKLFRVSTGAHNDNEEQEGKGRSAKRPRGRLKFQIVPTVVALLSLDIDDAKQRMLIALCISMYKRLNIHDTDRKRASTVHRHSRVLE